MKDYQERLKEFYRYLEEKSLRMIGYPVNQKYDFSELYDFFKLSINNIGDPLSDGPYKVKAHEFEKEVVTFVAEITGVKDNHFWGYVTNGGTEGNMYGLYLARETYPESIVYYSSEAHYSIPKVLKLLRMPSIAIATTHTGEMDLEDLRNVLQINRTKVPIILATIGTTMKGAVDPVSKIRELIHELAFPNYYLHCDAALGGMILPFCDGAEGFGLTSGVHSLSISGHKMFGSPMPCGVVVARKDLVDRIGGSIEYIGAIDTTLSGSRNGHTVMLLWYAIMSHGKEDYRRIVQECIALADYLIERLESYHIHSWRNDFSNTVVIPKPSADLINRWQIAVQGDIAHIITMPHVTREQIDQFIEEYVADCKDLDEAV